MSKSVAGGKAMKDMMSGIGKVVKVLTSGLTFLGDTMLSVFGYDSSTSAAVTAANNLEQAYRDLGKEMDEINKKSAQSGRQQAKNKRIADDDTISEKARISAVIKNYKIEQGINKDKLNNLKRTKKADEEAIKLQEQKVLQAKKDKEGVKEAIEEQDKLIKNLNATEIKLAQLRIKLDKDRVDVENDIDKVKQTKIDLDNAAHQAELDRFQEIRDAEEKRFEGTEKLVTETIEANQELIQADNSVLDNYLANNKKRKKSDEAMKVAKLEMTSAIGSAVGALGGLMEQGSAAQKATALTEIAVNTGVGLMQGLNVAQKASLAAGPGAALAFPIFYATQLAAVLGAAAQAKAVMGAGGGGGNLTPPSTTPSTPAPQMMSGAFELTGGV
jgi:hypothetical protein